jgi:hypothetical protein
LHLAKEDFTRLLLPELGLLRAECRRCRLASATCDDAAGQILDRDRHRAGADAQTNDALWPATAAVLYLQEAKLLSCDISKGRDWRGVGIEKRNSE